MTKLTRFGVSIEKKLAVEFDNLIKKQNYPNRSEAIRDMIREQLVKKEWMGKSEVAGTITLVYDHHKRDLLNSLVDIQHDYYHLIVANQHVHLDHDNCLEIIVVKGKPVELEGLANRLKSAKGVKHAQLTMTTTGKKVA
jgi:CopG family nickel-responsive transcriptional regulator